MKKVLTIISFSVILFSCQKSNLSEIQQTPLESEATATAVTSSAQRSTTVTTESALVSAVSSAAAGDVITVSGTIRLTKTLKLTKNGTSGAKITLTGGTLDCAGISGTSRGVELSGNYWIVSNMTIKNAPDNGLLLQTGGHNTVSNVKTLSNKDTGIQIYNGAHDNTVINCYSAENYDPANGGENADGFACKLSSGANNKFQSCTAFHNSDDGWDLFDNPNSVTITGCTASKNGWGTNGDGNGFKLGSAGQHIPHTVTNNNAINNKAWGYDGNGNTGHITITGSTGSGNGKGLFARIF